ncbi:hypothetical protein KFK09_003690 [Dendrobium nobile]|uniref:Uncharacterized protein n=1 Tax=Dendrobium nobile TaxID=94219 RepID=A0A8T3C0X6_DENNO|nr:hypothetical protein KFK09_003690 [Dendrobium nobile]
MWHILQCGTSVFHYTLMEKEYSFYFNNCTSFNFCFNYFTSLSMYEFASLLRNSPI